MMLSKSALTMMAMAGLLFAAFSSSSNYSLQSYGIGSGATNTSSSPNYRLNANSGEVDSGAATGTADVGNSGSTQAGQSNVPKAPTLSNGSGSYYNKLNCIINTSGSDASDYTYTIAASTNSFSTTYYVQADGTLGTSPVFQTYSTWGGSSGVYLTGLSANTTYQVKVSARQGSLSQSAYGPVASSATANPSVTFSITPNSLSLGSLLPATITTSPSIAINFATNGANGGSVYVAGQNAGLKSVTAAYTIPAVSADLSSQAQGFGVQASAASQTSGATLTLASPYNASGTIVGTEGTSYQTILTASGSLVGGTATINLKAKASAITPAANDYQEVVTFVASANF